jgi:hypothetical protein
MLETKYMNNVENCILRSVTQNVKHDALLPKVSGDTSWVIAFSYK